MVVSLVFINEEEKSARTIHKNLSFLLYSNDDAQCDEFALDINLR